MTRSFLQPFIQAFQNIRANWFHTLLSILGIVIGVAALVTILSLIDGMEEYARDQITNTTSIKAIAIQAESHKEVNNISVRKDSFAVMDYENFKRLIAETGPFDRTVLTNRFNREVHVPGNTAGMGVFLNGIAGNMWEDSVLQAGNMIPATAFDKGQALAMVNEKMADLIHHKKGETAIGKSFVTMDRTFTVVGVVKNHNSEDPPKAYVPISIFSDAEMHLSPPSCFLEAKLVEDVPVQKAKILNWIKKTYGQYAQDFIVETQDTRVNQAAQAFLLFRIVMGLIVGISVLVGGIGVMNVLLISVTERTAEIGMRKALGARKKDILRLFLSESITISTLGSLLGLIFGVLVTMLAVPIIKAITHLPFQANYTLNTLLVISIVAIIIGIVFGTYPAMKAAKLDPVEAIRRE